MNVWWRLSGGVLVLTVYTWVLKPPAASVSSRVDLSDARAERDFALSDAAFKAGRYADALQPTSRLVQRFPAQHVYVRRLAEIFWKLGRPAEEAAASERVVELTPTPVEGCLEGRGAVTIALPLDSGLGSGIAIAPALIVGVGLRGAETSESRSPSSEPLSDAVIGPCAMAISGLTKIGPWSGQS
jgi:hypothetical protein